MNYYNKLTAYERLAAIGSVVVIVGFIVSLLGAYGFGGNTIALLGAIAVLAIYFLKYSPSQTMTWPAPIPTIVLAISAITAILAILGALPVLGLLGGLGMYTLGAIVTVIGAIIMVWGAWQDYQAMPKATPPTGGPRV